MIEYALRRSGQKVVLHQEVLTHFDRFRQTGWRREAGGQLFARFNGLRIDVLRATGPRRTDRRGRNFYIPDRRAEQREIDAHYAEGLHFVGDWHTHAEQVPCASSRDAASMGDTVKKSAHELQGFLLVVVGRADPPDGLSVSLHDGERQTVLVPVEPSA